MPGRLFDMKDLERRIRRQGVWGKVACVAMSARACDGPRRVLPRVKRAVMDGWGRNLGHVAGEGKGRILWAGTWSLRRKR